MLNFILCKNIEDLICDNCIFWKPEEQCSSNISHEVPQAVGSLGKGFGRCRTSKPPWETTLPTDSCGDGMWLCEHWSHNEDKYPVVGSYLREDFLHLIDFVESKLNEEKHRDYTEREERQREKYKKGGVKTTKDKLERFDWIIDTMSDDLYAIKEKLGLNY
jgi:hypothetical protein